MALIAWLLLLLLVYLGTRRAGARALGFVSAAAWLTLPFYNRWVLADCPGDCAIRVDLLIVGPVLLVVTIGWLLALWRQRRRRRVPAEP